ncbi:MAG: MBL fold metallo-hydrolase [Myxococcota bacterium]
MKPIAAVCAVTVASTATAAGKLYTFTSDVKGFDTHSFYLDTGREVIVFDAQFTEELAKKLLAEIQAKTSSPIRYLVLTHPNPDKFNGAQVFRAAGAKVVASKATAAAIAQVHAYKRHFFVNVAQMFTPESYPPQAEVDLVFEGKLSLPLAAGKVELHQLRHSGVSSTQTVASLPKERALLVGDLVHHQAHAWLEGGIENGQPTPNLEAWRKALEELRLFKGTTVYGGRGKAAPVEVAVRAQKDYLTRLERLVTRYVADLGPRRAELAGPKAAEHHKKLALLAQEAFPEYAHPYLVEYGVYGLVNAIAARVHVAR